MKRNTRPAVTVVTRNGRKLGSVRGFAAHELDDAVAYALAATKLGKHVTVNYYQGSKTP